MSAAVRAAIRLHPRAWRERYAEEVLGTLQDVADDRGGRVPLGETLPLALRGLWLRVRGSVTFWAGVLVIMIFVTYAASVDPGFGYDDSLTGYLLRLNEPAGFALPVLALAAGWAGARARAARIVGIGARLRRAAAESWPLLAFAVVGYALAVILVVLRFGVPWAAFPAPIALVGQAAVVLLAIAVGQALGSVLPRVLVIFVAPIAVGTLAILIVQSRTGLSAAPWGFYAGLEYEVDLSPFWRLLATVGVIVASAILVIVLRPVRARVAVVLAVAGVAVGLAVQPVDPIGVSPFAERSRAELVCSTDEPVICLWPEQEAAFGARVRAEMADAYTTAVTLGLPVGSETPRNAAKWSLAGSPMADDPGYDPDALTFGVSGSRSEDLVANWAAWFVVDFGDESIAGSSEGLALTQAISVLLGVPPESTVVARTDPLTGDRLFDPSEIPDEATARSLVERWLSEGVDGVRAPGLAASSD